MSNPPVLIIDYGSQYTQLIARRVREQGVYSLILPGDVTLERMQSFGPRAVILSGGPSSVYEEGAPTLPSGFLEFQKKEKLPVLGICYGMQLLARDLGGEVKGSHSREYGRMKVLPARGTKLLSAFPFHAWMSHGDETARVPAGFTVTAKSEAQTHSASGPLTNALFQRALNVAKRVRTDTRLAEGRVSIASVAVGDFGKRIFDRFDDKVVLVIGAGEMAIETLRYLQHEGVRHVRVTNRTREKAEEVAAQFGGVVRPFEKLDEWLVEADVIVSTTGADPPLVDCERFRRVRAKSGGKPVFILDLGVPRDFEPAVRDIDDDVFLYCIDDLDKVCEEHRTARSREVERALQIVDQETDRFMAELYHRATGPIIKRLREHHHGVVDEELGRGALRRAEDAAEVGECFGLEQALKRFDGNLSWAAFAVIEDLRQAGHVELRRKFAKRHLQLVSRRAG